MSKSNIKSEVAHVLGRELIGHETAVVLHLSRAGMVNPVDIAREVLTRHVANIERAISLQQEALMSQRAALAELPLTWTRIEA